MADPPGPEIVFVVAVARNGVIGRDNALPWHIPDDLRRFRAITTGHPLLMGRRTFESIGRPLPGRTSIVLTRNAGWRQAGVTVVHDLAAGLAAGAAAPGGDRLMLIGGGELFTAAMPLATRIELTMVDLAPDGDAFMPAIDRRIWREAARTDVPAAGDVPGHSFVTLVRGPDPCR